MEGSLFALLVFEPPELDLRKGLPVSGPSMAEVLAGHQFMHHSFNGMTGKRYLACSCGESPLAGDHPTHLASALAAAGFGDVRAAGAEALEAAADDFGVNLTAMSGPRIRDWLRAKAVRGEG